MTEILLAVGIVAAALVALGLMILRANAEAKDQAKYADMVAYMRERDRAAAEADAQSKALQLYSLQATLDVIKAQSIAQSRAQEQTVYALRQTVAALQEDHRTMDALAGMQWRALEAHYTAALPDKQKSGRYWEEVYYDD